MKKIITMMIMVCIISILGCVSAYANGLMLEYDGGVHEYTGSIYQLKVNGNLVKTPLEPIIFNDRALVPMREVFEEMGAVVKYDNDTKRVDVSMANQTVNVTIGSSEAYVNGAKTTIPDNVTPKLIAKSGESAKTMIPVRFISESIGMYVDFDGTNGIINITANQQNRVIDAKTAINSDTEMTLTIKSQHAMSSYNHFTMADPNRIVVDISNCLLGTTSKIDVNKNGVSAVRLGDDGARARIVIDTNTIKSYDVSQSSDKKTLTVKLVTDTVSTPAPVPPTTTGKIIVLDAGHGGKDGGASGTYGGTKIYEKDLTLSITQKVKNILGSNGYSVRMTRDGDTYPELTERAEFANGLNAAMFVSIHINSVDNAPTASGTEVYYSTQNNDADYWATSEDLAKSILNCMISKMGTRNRGVKTAEHVVTRKSNMPAVLVEVGFLSNEEELGKMIDDNFQNQVAQGIAEGIMTTIDYIALPQ